MHFYINTGFAPEGLLKNRSSVPAKILNSADMQGCELFLEERYDAVEVSIGWPHLLLYFIWIKRMDFIRLFHVGSHFCKKFIFRDSDINRET